MPLHDYATLTPEALVKIVQNTSRSKAEQTDAVNDLVSRFKSRILCTIRDHMRFCSASGYADMGDFFLEVLFDAIEKYDPQRGMQFYSFLYMLSANAVCDVFRKKKRDDKLKEALKVDAEQQKKNAAKKAGADEGVHFKQDVVLEKTSALVHECALEMDERSMRIFVWCAVRGIPYARLHEIMPDITAENYKKIRSRAAAAFYPLWIKHGGADVEGMRDAAVAMSSKFDVGKIRDEKAREAYRCWADRGHDINTAAVQLGISEDALRKLLRTALNDIFEQGMLRGGRLSWKELATRQDELAAYLELSEGDVVKGPLVQRIERVLDLVRAAFGFGPVEKAFHTLGSFVQLRMNQREDYENACRELQLTRPELRRLIADRGDPPKGLFPRLAQLLNTSEDFLLSLPRESPAPAPALRSAPLYDRERFRERIRQWIRSR